MSFIFEVRGRIRRSSLLGLGGEMSCERPSWSYFLSRLLRSLRTPPFFGSFCYFCLFFIIICFLIIFFITSLPCKNVYLCCSSFGFFNPILLRWLSCCRFWFSCPHPPYAIMLLAYLSLAIAFDFFPRFYLPPSL